MVVPSCLLLSLLAVTSQVLAEERVEQPRSLTYLLGKILYWPERAEQDRVEQPSCELLITKWTKWSNPGPGTSPFSRIRSYKISAGLAATIDLPVLRDIESWTIVLDFNKNFSKLNFFNAVSKSSSGSRYELSNESWSGKKKAGDHIKFSLLGDYEEGEGGHQVAVNTITLNDDVMCPVNN